MLCFISNRPSASYVCAEAVTFNLSRLHFMKKTTCACNYLVSPMNLDVTVLLVRLHGYNDVAVHQILLKKNLTLLSYVVAPSCS